MKKIIVPALALVLTATTVNAQTAPAAATTQAQANQDEKVKVEVKDLPGEVIKTLSTDEYKGWTATEAWHVTGEGEHYVIDLAKGEEKLTVKLNKEGKKVG
ncbi:MAG: hypothetical protein JNL72_01220 [Flavipsychrobacter sp.]|nr:hypothetical protein [Flavipsychrobacter sp.]